MDKRKQKNQSHRNQDGKTAYKKQRHIIEKKIKYGPNYGRNERPDNYKWEARHHKIRKYKKKGKEHYQ